MYQVVPEAPEMVQLRTHFWVQKRDPFENASGRHCRAARIGVWHEVSQQVLKPRPLCKEGPAAGIGIGLTTVGRTNRTLVTIEFG